MPNDELFWRCTVALASALVYWAGVLVQARRVRKQIGKSPNLRPRGSREKLLWAGWLLVIVIWIAQPFVTGLRFVPFLLHPLALFFGVALTIAGYAGTLWCYAAMGDTWRIGINRKEQTTLVTHGPYRWVRHPIYSFQSVMLVGVVLLLPTALSLIMLALHLLCVGLKAADEEAHLLTIHGQSYRDYRNRTGKLFPKFHG